MQKISLLLASSLVFGCLVVAQARSVAPGPSLGADVLSLSISEGGDQAFLIEAGPAYAGYIYMVSGSTSGVFPGVVRDSVVVPLNMDAYSVMLQAPQDPKTFKGFYGRLDSKGQAKPVLSLPEDREIDDFIGTIFHHSVVLLDPKTKVIMAATNPVELLLLP